jgi:hypothetical protein
MQHLPQPPYLLLVSQYIKNAQWGIQVISTPSRLLFQFFLNKKSKQNYSSVYLRCVQLLKY